MIAKTYFTTYDLQPIADYLSTNATEYFDKVEISEDKLTISCYVGDLEAMKITSSSLGGGLLSFTFACKDGYSKIAKPGNRDDYTKVYIYRITKTSTGIAFAIKGSVHCIKGSTVSSGTITARDAVYVTKDNNGNTAFAFLERLATGTKFLNIGYNGHEYLYSANINLGIFGTTGFSSDSDFGEVKKDYIQLAQVPISGQGICYLPNCLTSVYTNILGTECTLEQGGNKYVYNGYIALKE